MAACENPWDVLRMKQEELGTILYRRAAYKDPWLNLIQSPSEYGVGAGLNKSTFTIGRSEPTTEEEAWVALAVEADGNHGAACNVNYTQVEVGHKEAKYGPVGFGLKTPLICKDDLPLHFESSLFWEQYFQTIDQRQTKSITNRLQNVYMNMVPAALAHPDMTWTDPLHFTSIAASVGVTIAPSAVDLSDLAAPVEGTTICDLTQDVLDETALTLNEIGAFQPNSAGWLNMGPDGPEYPILIGQAASARLSKTGDMLQNTRDAYSSLPESSPLFKRLGATKVIRNFRHLITMFPPRWDYVDGVWVRRNAWKMSSAAADATKGYSGIIDPLWKAAAFEGALVLNPWVYHREPLRPVDKVGSAVWRPGNYMGDWQFVTGTDALDANVSALDCKDPLHKKGRFFGEYRHAEKPIFPEYGRLLIFKRCTPAFECVSCGS